jgi:hypothetical protein
MEQLSKIIDVLATAIADGHTVTIKADEITIKDREMTASALEITVE